MNRKVNYKLLISERNYFSFIIYTNIDDLKQQKHTRQKIKNVQSEIFEIFKMFKDTHREKAP